ncbi:hypothetical protein KC333_g4487 [Hortaea werneckii]|nr:hypothetical protein KC333_g4487 [Hortaea werneckii]KAI7316331.1 hypothetical protein KC326_g4394 [Hortaea werneckii]
MEVDKTSNNRVHSTEVGNASRADVPSTSQQTADQVWNNESGIAGGAEPDGTPTATSGVKRVEAFNRMLAETGRGKALLWTLGVSLLLTMFAYALDQGITYQFTVIAASSFNRHSEVGAVSTASTIIRAISKPFIGKLSDITSRPITYCVILVFYAVGFAVAASCETLGAYIVGIAFTACGKSGLDLLSDIIVADLTPLQWRAFCGALLSTPFLITVPLDGFISAGFVPDNWRWGLGMFSIMVPVLLIPAIITLFGIQHKAAKHGMVSIGDSGFARKGDLEKMGKKPSIPQIIWQAVIDIDLFGLILLGFAFALILLPLTLARSATNGWANPSFPAMIVCGFVILIGFICYEALLAPKPVVTRKLLLNKTFMLAIGIDISIQLASGIRATYFSSYIWIVKDWSNYAWTIFLGATTLGLCFIAPIGGHLATTSTARLVCSQVLFGFGSFVVIGTRVASQASVPHEDVATVIANLALWSTLGSSVGASIASAIWSNLMLGYMREEMPNTPAATLQKIYGSITVLHSRPFDDPVRQGGIRAYSKVLGLIFVISAVIAAVEFVLTLFMPNYFLGRQQNAATNLGLDGKPVAGTPSDENEGRPAQGFVGKVKQAYLRQS